MQKLIHLGKVAELHFSTAADCFTGQFIFYCYVIYDSEVAAFGAIANTMSSLKKCFKM